MIGRSLAQRGLRDACGRVIAQGCVGSGGLIGVAFLAALAFSAHSSRASVCASLAPGFATAAVTSSAPAAVAPLRCLALQVLVVLAAPVAVAVLLPFAAVG